MPHKAPTDNNVDKSRLPAQAGAPPMPTDAPIDDHAAHLEDIAKAIEQLQRAAIFKIAEHLAEAQGIFRYRRDEGGFRGWVETRLRFSRQTAYSLLHVRERFGGQSVKYLDTFPATVLYLLTAPSTPEQARDEIIARAEAGEKLPVAEVKRTISAAKGHRQPRSRLQSAKSHAQSTNTGMALAATQPEPEQREPIERATAGETVSAKPPEKAAEEEPLPVLILREWRAAERAFRVSRAIRSRRSPRPFRLKAATRSRGWLSNSLLFSRISRPD